MNNMQTRWDSSESITHPIITSRERFSSIFFFMTCTCVMIGSYAIVHAAYFPGQLSPDSIDQWLQLSRWTLNDAHPVLSTLLFRFFSLINDSPQFIILCNYVLFSISASILLYQLDRTYTAPRLLLLSIAFILAVFPPNFFIVTTLWKDVPYASGLTLITAGLIKLSLKRDAISRSSLLFLGFGCVLTMGMRHNGILVVMPLMVILLLWAKCKLRIALATMLTFLAVVFILSKSLLLSITGSSPLDPAYKTIFALPPLAAMVSAQDAALSIEEKKLLSEVMPLSTWQSAYSCSTVVPLFWNNDISREALRSNVQSLNNLALRWILNEPLQFLKHQSCMTAIIWNPLPNQGQWIPISPREITQFSVSESLNLKTESMLPVIRDFLDVKIAPLWEKSTILNRPATYMWVGIVLCFIAIIRGATLFSILPIPALLNAISLVPIIGSQDFRYMWPTMVIFIVLGICAIPNIIQKYEYRQNGVEG